MATFALWDKTYKYLKDKGLDVYPPSTKQGECKKDYIVLKGDVTSQALNFSSEYHYYLVLSYSKTYTGVLKLVDKVKHYMNEYAPNMMPTGIENPPYWDDSVKAFMVSVQYRANARNNKL